MTAEHLLTAIGLVDDALILDAGIVPERKRTVWRSWAVLAACLALVIALGHGLTQLDGGSNGNAGGSTGSAGGGMASGNGAGMDSNGGFAEQGLPVCIAVDGVLYQSTGIAVPGEVAEDDIRVSDDRPGAPAETEEDFQFLGHTSYAVTDLGLVVLLDHEWVLFEPFFVSD